MSQQGAKGVSSRSSADRDLHPAGLRVDPFRFAAEGRQREGRLALAKLSRLAELLVSRDGELRWKLRGFTVEPAESPARAAPGKALEPRLQLEVEGRLELRCQRCLETLPWPLAIRSVLHPVAAGQAIADEELEDDEVDAIEVDGELDVLALVEDEVLLALPIAPRHENCTPTSGAEAATEESPFAALASLRGSGQAR